ncbi:RNA polymerase sigma factor [Flavitalea flava]
MSVKEIHSERELLQQVAAGDEKAFTQLFYAYHHKLGAYVLAWTKSISLAEEIVQDVFMKVWNKRETLRTVERFDSYLYIIARNYTFNSMRQAARVRLRQQAWLQYLESEKGLADGPVPEDYGLLIEEAVRQLSPQQQKVYRLKRQQGLKYEEIGRQLQISPETARKHLATATQHIRVYVQTHINVTLLILSTPLLLS